MKLIILKKINLIIIFTFSALFLTSCNGSTTIYGIEHQSKKKHKKYKRHRVSYEKHRSLPPGQYKKIHGEKSAKKYVPHKQKKYNKKKKHHND